MGRHESTKNNEITVSAAFSECKKIDAQDSPCPRATIFPWLECLLFVAFRAHAVILQVRTKDATNTTIFGIPPCYLVIQRHVPE
jgi:hypothetical protein